MNKKISELLDTFHPDDIQGMAIMDYRNNTNRVQLNRFDCTDEEDAIERVKQSIKDSGHVLIIPYKPL